MITNRINFYWIRPSPCSERVLLRAAVAVPLLSWLIFSALLSGWSWSISYKLAPVLWYGGSTALLIAVLFFVMWALLWNHREGRPPETPPLAGALRPVPIHPSPRLVRSAAEPLPASAIKMPEKLRHVNEEG